MLTKSLGSGWNGEEANRREAIILDLFCRDPVPNLVVANQFVPPVRGCRCFGSQAAFRFLVLGGFRV